MNRLRIIPLDDAVVFPGMPITLPVDVGTDERVLLVPRHDNVYAKVGVSNRAQATAYVARHDLAYMSGLPRSA